MREWLGKNPRLTKHYELMKVDQVSMLMPGLKDELGEDGELDFRLGFMPTLPDNIKDEFKTPGVQFKAENRVNIRFLGRADLLGKKKGDETYKKVRDSYFTFGMTIDLSHMRFE